MNGAHLHLLVNHVPLFGVAFGVVALIWSIARKSDEMRWAAYALFISAGIFGWIAVKSGESAEKIAEHLPRVTQALIENHADAAELANIFASILAVGSVLMALVARFRKGAFLATQMAFVALSVTAAALMARAANLGGQIRHTEIRSGVENAEAVEEGCE